MSDQINPAPAEENETPASGLLLSVEPLSPQGGASYRAMAGDGTDTDTDAQDTSDAGGEDSDGSDASDADGTDAEESDADGTDAADADGTDTGFDADGTDPLGIASDGRDK